MTLGSPAVQTLELLEKRLARLHFLVHGDDDSAPQPHQTQDMQIAARIQGLSKSLASLQSHSPAMIQILNLRTSNEHDLKFCI